VCSGFFLDFGDVLLLKNASAKFETLKKEGRE